MTLHDELMSSRNQVDSILSVEFLDDLTTEEVTSATRRHHPSGDIIGVTPHQVAHGTVVRNLLFTVDLADFIQSGDRRGKTTVHAENPFVNNSSQGQKVEDFSAVAPYVDRAVLAEALIIEAINLSNLA